MRTIHELANHLDSYAIQACMLGQPLHVELGGTPEAMVHRDGEGLRFEHGGISVSGRFPIERVLPFDDNLLGLVSIEPIGTFAYRLEPSVVAKMAREAGLDERGFGGCSQAA